MLHRLITNTKLAQIEPHHLRLNLHLIELLPAIDANDAANHFRHDNHVAEVGFDEVGLLVGFGVLFGFAEFFNEAHGFAFEASVEAAAGAGVDDVAELFRGEVEESVEVGVSWIFLGAFRPGSVKFSEKGVALEVRFAGNIERTGRDRCRGRRICGRFSSS